MSDDSDDELGAFSFLRGLQAFNISEEPQVDLKPGEQEGPYAQQSSVCGQVDRLLMLRDSAGLRQVKADGCEALVVKMALKVLDGRHIEVVSSETMELSLRQLRDTCALEVDAVDAIRRIALEFIEKGESSVARECRAMQCLIVATAYLELYCQSNYTGPELLPAEVELLVGGDNGVALHATSVRHLECDGELAYRMCELPHTLLIARSIFLSLCDPMRASWDRGIALSDSGAIDSKRAKIDFAKRFPESCRCVSSLVSGSWRSARAAVVHARLLPNLSYDKVPTLWKECGDWFGSALRRWACEPSTTADSSSSSSNDTVNDRLLQTQLWLEWGLCHHHFSFDDKGKRLFAKAQCCAGLEAFLSGAMGKRTKHQQMEHAQMLLVARSGLMASGAVSAPTKPALPSGTGPEVDHHASSAAVVPPATPNEWQHGEWEMGRRLITETACGEEAAVREVLLDSMDGGASQNIMLEGGPAFSDPNLDHGGELHPVDQAVILALCIDVANSNPADGLTSEVMMPYLTRVLQAAQNWMIHSTGLLERSWLEYHQQRLSDRAMLQIQALLDQHTTKLTVMQSTYKSVTEDSAPVQERLQYIHCIVYPSQCELKKDLAQRYLRGSVVASALGLFRELELWDEVVTCYQLMEKPHRAEMVVRERLKSSGDTPYMLTALADLTQDESLYERAWELSRHRYGRAKRTLAKISFDRGDFLKCSQHLDAALAVHPLVPHAWYLKGLACMRIESYDEALLAFSRCVQQDMDIGEAWANCGAIHMKRREHAKAFVSLTEALRHKRDSWQVMENLMICSLVLCKWRECVVHMNTLLDMRGKSGRPVHQNELRHLALMVAVKARRAFDDVAARRVSAASARAGSGDSGASNPAEDSAPAPQSLEWDENTVEIPDDHLPEVVRAVESLLVRITNTLPSDPEVWDILARFEAYLGRFRLVLDCRVRQFRTLTGEPAWEKDRASVVLVIEAASKLVAAHDAKFNKRGVVPIVSKADRYACTSLLQTAQRRLDVIFAGLPESRQLADIYEALIGGDAMGEE